MTCRSSTFVGFRAQGVLRSYLGMRQDLDLSARREVKQRIDSLLSYYLPQLGPEHTFCVAVAGATHVRDAPGAA